MHAVTHCYTLLLHQPALDPTRLTSVRPRVDPARPDPRRRRGDPTRPAVHGRGSKSLVPASLWPRGAARSKAGPAFSTPHQQPQRPRRSSKRARRSRMEQVLGRSLCACASAAALRRQGTAPVHARELRRCEARAAPRSARARARGAWAGAAAAGDGVGVVLVDHGSRKAESNDQLVRAAAASWREAAPHATPLLRSCASWTRTKRTQGGRCCTRRTWSWCEHAGGAARR